MRFNGHYHAERFIHDSIFIRTGPEKTIACVRQMTRDFDTATERRKSFDAKRVAFHLQLKNPDLRRCVWKGYTTPKDFQWFKPAIARKKALAEQALKDAAVVCQALVQWAEDLEKREARYYAAAPPPVPTVGPQQRQVDLDAATAQSLPAPDRLADDGSTPANGERFATEPSPNPTPGVQQQQINPDAAIAQPLPDPDGWFPAFVMSKLKLFARILQQQYGGLSKVAQLAVLKFVGEEYSGRGPWDEVQDWNAGTGYGGTDLGFRDPLTGLPTIGIPDKWRTSNDPIKRGLTQLDLLDHDLGVANINLKAAALLSGITSPDQINALAKYLTTDIGTVDYAVRFVKQAQEALSPLIRGMDAETQAQIIVDFVREGPDKFWNRQKALKGLNDAQLKAWIQAPYTYKGPNGTVPSLPKPNPKMFKRTQYEQIEKALDW
jgi:hypothetical protein